MSSPKRKQLTQELNKQIRILTDLIIFSKSLQISRTPFYNLDAGFLSNGSTAGKLAELTKRPPEQ
jgi:hypothetical protein